MRNEIALVAWITISAGAQDLLASFFQSPYCNVFNKNLMTYFQLPTDASQAITTVLVQYSKK